MVNSPSQTSMRQQGESGPQALPPAEGPTVAGGEDAAWGRRWEPGGDGGARLCQC